MATVYILFSEKDHGWYTGATRLTANCRFASHVKGKVKSTRSRRPLLLSYIEIHASWQKAAKREWYLKHPKGYSEKRQILQQLLLSKDRWPVVGPIPQVGQ